MSQFVEKKLTFRAVDELREWLLEQKPVFSYFDDIRSSLLFCYILSIELGGANDDLSKFTFDPKTQAKVDQSQMKITVGSYGQHNAVSVTSSQAKEFAFSIPALYDAIHIKNGQLIIVPDQIAMVLKQKGIEPVLVKDWVKKFVFSDFDPKEMPYQRILRTSIVKDNDARLFARLVANRQLAFQGIHDIVAHAAGANSEGFLYAEKVAKKVTAHLDDYFGKAKIGNMASHLVPFMIGLLLDDLVQEPFYFNGERTEAIDELLKVVHHVDPKQPLLLKAVPTKFSSIIEIARKNYSRDRLRNEISACVEEIKSLVSVA